MARRRFFVDEVREGAAELTGDEARHLARVLRAEPGQLYEVSDNQRAYLAKVREAGSGRVIFDLLAPVPPRPVAVVAVAYVALVRFERFEQVIEKATELGAAEIVPFEGDRSEKGLALAARKRLERWNRVAREAGQQSRRDRLPEIHPPAPFSGCLADGAAWRFFLDEEPGAPPLVAALPPPDQRRQGDRVAFLAGPEGGWTGAERQAALAAGWKPVSLGPLVLRTETAVTAALAVIVCTWLGASP